MDVKRKKLEKIFRILSHTPNVYQKRRENADTEIDEMAATLQCVLRGVLYHFSFTLRSHLSLQSAWPLQFRPVSRFVVRSLLKWIDLSSSQYVLSLNAKFVLNPIKHWTREWWFASGRCQFGIYWMVLASPIHFAFRAHFVYRISILTSERPTVYPILAQYPMATLVVFFWSCEHLSYGCLLSTHELSI